MTYLEQQSRDADDSVVTSARPLAIDRASLEDTWAGDSDRPERDGKSERIAALECLLENAQHREREQRARAEAVESKLVRADAHGLLYENILEALGEIRDGHLDAGIELVVSASARAKAVGVSPEHATGHFAVLCPVPFDLFGLIARIARRSAELRSAVPASAIVVPRDDAGDHARQDAS